MRCIAPKEIGPNKFPCGKCNFCLEVKRGDWSFRLDQELKVASGADFLTLTYSDENLPYGEELPSLCKRDVQLFLKRLRKSMEKDYGNLKLRYYAVGEYGTKTDRPHYHIILFNLPRAGLTRLNELWGLGHVHRGNVSRASIHYVTKYVVQSAVKQGGREPPFSLMSRRPGIGANYLGSHRLWHRDDMRNFVQVNGFKTRLPRYYKDRFFSEEERIPLSLQALDEGRKAIKEEFERLREFCEDPYRHYVDRVMHEHDAISVKVNSQSKM